MTARSAGDNGRRCFIQINTYEGDPVSHTFCVFFAYKKNYEQFETSPEIIEQELRSAV